MNNETITKFASLGVKDIAAAELYMFAIENNLDETKVKITKTDIERMQSLINKNPIIEEVNRRVNEYRNLFKDTRGEDERGVLRTVLINLRRFMVEHKCSFDYILEHTKNYIDQFYGDFRYMRRADYFLYKYVDGNWISPLEEFINNMNSNSGEILIK